MRRLASTITALGLLAACEFQIPSPTYIHQTKLISVSAEVELGPLHPDRVGLASEAPIAEILPGDQLRFDAVVVNPEGDRIAASELDSVWFSCGAQDCGVSNFIGFGPEFDVPCDELDDLTMDERCRLGEGDGQFAFTVPALGRTLLDTRLALYYGVIAFEGRSAEDCWAARKAADEPLERCAFIRRQVKIGPSWWLLAYAQEVLGFSSVIPLWQLPAAVYAQAANRTPRPQIDVIIDGELAGAWPDTSEYVVSPATEITLAPSYSPTEQLAQTYFIASLDQLVQIYWFSPTQEAILETPHSTRALHVVGVIEPGLRLPLDFVVDEFAEPSATQGVSKIFLVYADDRFGEGIAEIVFEVVP